MELLDRYLQAVKKHLAWKRQDDIVAELKANLEAQLEDKEEALGRPLTQGESEDWLRQIGAPAQVAARYQPQRYLIGPAVFGAYWYLLRMVLLWAGAIYTIVNVVQIAATDASAARALQTLLGLPGLLMAVAAWVTLAFVILEEVGRRFPEKIPAELRELGGFTKDWSPSSLPPVEKEAPAGKRPRTYSIAVTEVVFGFLFLGWLLLLPQNPFLLLGPGAAYLESGPYTLTPIWVPFFWCVVAFNFVQAGWRWVDLMRGQWQNPAAAQKALFKVFGIVPLVVLLFAGEQMWVMLKHPSLDQMAYGSTVDQFNLAIRRGLMVVLAIVLLQLAWDAGKYGLKVYRQRALATRA